MIIWRRLLELSIRIDHILFAEFSDGSNRSGEYEIVAGRETSRQVYEILDVVLEGHAGESFAGLRIVNTAYDQAKINVRIGIAIEFLKLASSCEQLDFELMFSGLDYVEHEQVGAV